MITQTERPQLFGSSCLTGWWSTDALCGCLHYSNRPPWSWCAHTLSCWWLCAVGVDYDVLLRGSDDQQVKVVEVIKKVIPRKTHRGAGTTFTGTSSVDMNEKACQHVVVDGRERDPEKQPIDDVYDAQTADLDEHRILTTACVVPPLTPQLPGTSLQCFPRLPRAQPEDGLPSPEAFVQLL